MGVVVRFGRRPMSSDELDALRRIATALERLADHFAPIQRKERKPAILGVAAYSEEERERLQLKDALKKQAQKQA